ncbi:MAG: DUF5675 family protein [Prevotellaceae bacterium]|jgi:hypothetical protein|nr:DUF5675 family protein [Prevotellaceae bacterium]
MNLTLTRKVLTPDYTIGELYIDGVKFCDTLEDTVRDKNHDGDLNDPGEEKVYGKTAIPCGKYPVIFSYSPSFVRWLPEILNVSGFSGIRIHRGNTPKDTHGCILVGENSITGQVRNSTKYELEICKKLKEAGKAIITITDK